MSTNEKRKNEIEKVLLQSLIMYQTIESMLKDYIIEAKKYQFSAFNFFPPLSDKAIKRINGSSLGKLVDEFEALNTNTPLHKELRNIIQKRNKTAHGRFYKLHFENLNKDLNNEEYLRLFAGCFEEAESSQELVGLVLEEMKKLREFIYK